MLQGVAEVRNKGQQAPLEGNRRGEVGPALENEAPSPFGVVERVGGGSGLQRRVTHRLVIMVA
jgi:hypothetical protein